MLAKFMPYNPAIKVSGMKIEETMVSSEHVAGRPDRAAQLGQSLPEFMNLLHVVPGRSCEHIFFHFFD